MTMQGWGVKTIAGLGVFAGWFLACAGDDIPPIEDELRGALAQNFGGASMETGSAGSGSGGRGGSGSGTSGSSGSANNAGSGNAGGGAAGDGGEPVGGGGGVDAPDCDAFPILQDSCGLVGCHGEGSRVGEFGVSEDDIPDFVDRASSANTCDALIIDSANPDQSLIYTKLFMDFPDGCGTLQMPAAGDFLTEDEVLCVLGWLGRYAK